MAGAAVGAAKPGQAAKGIGPKPAGGVPGGKADAKPAGKGGAVKAREGGGVLAARSQAAPSAAQLDQASASSRSAAIALISLCHSVIQSSASWSSPSGPRS